MRRRTNGLIDSEHFQGNVTPVQQTRIDDKQLAGSLHTYTTLDPQR